MGFEILKDRCELCGKCTEPDFCLQNLFEMISDEEGNKFIQFKTGDFSLCKGCLKCFKDCPNNAIIPTLIDINSSICYYMFLLFQH